MAQNRKTRSGNVEFRLIESCRESRRYKVGNKHFTDELAGEKRVESDSANRGFAGRELKPNVTDSSQYTFDEQQKALFQELSDRMRFVSRCLLWLGIPGCIISIIATWQNDKIHSVISTFQIFVFFFISARTAKTASSFKGIIEKSKVNDMAKLRLALRDIRKLYKLQRNILEVTWFILLVASVLVLVISVWKQKFGQ